MHTRLRKFLSAAITVLVTLIFLEVFLQIAARVSPRLDFALSLKQARHLDDDELVWRPHPGHPDHDRKGFRNARIPNEIKVLVLGDSQTYGTGVKRDETWVHQLGTVLKEPTYSMAYGGYGPLHSLILFDEALELQPNEIIEAMYTGNDLYDSYLLVYVNNRAPEHRSKDAVILDAIDVAEAEDPGAPKLPWLQKPQKEPQAARRDTVATNSARGILSEHSRLYGFLRACRRVVTQATRGKEDAGLLWSKDWELTRDLALERPDNFHVVEIDTFKTILTPQYRRAALDTNDPRVAEGLRLSLEAIREMNATAYSLGITYRVLLIPTKELVFKELMEESDPLPASVAELSTAEEYVLETIKHFLEEENIPYLEVLPILRGCIKEGQQPYQITPDGHPNRIGHRAIAEAVQSVMTETE